MTNTYDDADLEETVTVTGVGHRSSGSWPSGRKANRSDFSGPRGHGVVVAVEGYVDVIAMTAAGFPNVVAPLGTALTIDQCDP